MLRPAVWRDLITSTYVAWGQLALQNTDVTYRLTQPGHMVEKLRQSMAIMTKAPGLQRSSSKRHRLRCCNYTTPNKHSRSRPSTQAVAQRCSTWTMICRSRHQNPAGFRKSIVLESKVMSRLVPRRPTLDLSVGFPMKIIWKPATQTA